MPTTEDFSDLTKNSSGGFQSFSGDSGHGIHRIRKKEMEAQHSSSSHPSKLDHFSHSHELMFKEEQKEKNYDDEVVFCNACEEPVFGPRYSCNRCVDPNSTFNLHKSCAEELSCEIIKHPIHKHKLKFKCKTEPSAVLFTCNACHQPCRLAYACSPCHLALDLKCASNWRHILDRKKPHVHQFSVLRKGNPFDCEVTAQVRIHSATFVPSTTSWSVRNAHNHYHTPSKLPRTNTIFVSSGSLKKITRMTKFVKSAIQAQTEVALFMYVVVVITLPTLYVPGTK